MTGVWSPAPLSKLLVVFDLPYPKTSAIGLQMIIDWVLSSIPMALGLLVVGVALLATSPADRL